MSTSQNPIHIVADSREATSGIVKRLVAMPGYTVDCAQLDCGDYMPAPGVVVERKAGQDFVNSILDGRLMPQVKLMCAEFAQVVILIEGSIFDTRSAIAPAALHGAMSWLCLLERARIVYSRDQEDSAGLIAAFARHMQHGLGYEIPLRPGKPKDLSVGKQFAVEGLPGVGPGRAQALIKHFGSVRGVFSASEAELAKAPGLGAKTAQKIAQLLDAGAGTA